MQSISKRVKKFVIYTALLFLVAFILAVINLWRYRINLVQNQAIPRLESLVGFSVTGDVQGFDFVDGLVIKNLALGPQDKPVLKAREASLNISMLDILMNQILRQNSATFEITSLHVSGAMVSARNTEDGKLLFFPESKEPSQGQREKEKDQRISYWRIKKIEIKDSTIEVEDRKTKKQISLSRINLAIKNLGNNSLLEARGGLKLFIRDFGIDVFDPQIEFREALHGIFEFKELELFFTDQMAISTGAVNSALSDLSLFYDSKRLNQERLELSTVVDNKDGLVLRDLLIKGTHSDFQVKWRSPIDIEKARSNVAGSNFGGNDWNFDLSFKDFELENLNILGVEATGLSNLTLSTRPSGSQIDLTVAGDIKNLTGDLGSSRILEPVNIELQFESAIPKSLDVIKDGMTIKTMLASISIHEEKLLDVDMRASLSTGERGPKNFIKLNSSVLNVDEAQKIFVTGRNDNQDSTEPDPGDESGKSKENNGEPAPPICLKLSWPFSTTELDVDLAKLTYHGYTLDGLEVHGIANHHEIDLSAVKITKGENQLSSAFSMKLNDNQDYRLKVSSERINFESLKILYDELQNRAVSGSLKNIEFEANGFSRDTNLLKESLKATLKFNADDIFLPKELMDVVPFNLLFVPFSAVSAAFGAIPKEILPDRIINAGSGIAESFRQVQTFKINQGDFNMKIEDEVVRLEEVRIGTSISGEVYFSGQVKFNKEIAINSGISLVGVRVPLPISGTIDSPRPDIAQFIKGIFTEFGLSVVSLPVTFLKSVGGMFSRDKKVEEKVDENAEEKEVPKPEESKE